MMVIGLLAALAIRSDVICTPRFSAAIETIAELVACI